MTLAFVYAGQGSQHVGMGRDLYERFPSFRRLWDTAPVDFDLPGLCFDGPEDRLSQTRYTQPCMVAFAAGVTALLAGEGIRPAMAAGLSLGEYSALHAAGVWDAETVISLAAFRGRAMEQAVTGRDCSMTAVLGLDRDKLEDACAGARAAGVVEIANDNCPGQLVIAGDRAAVDKAAELAAGAGARRCVPLKVSGPFHTSLMKPAGDALQKKFETIPFAAPSFPVIFNATGLPLQPGETIPGLLEKQVQSGVRFTDTIRYMESQGVDVVIEIGPGKTLSGFIRKTAKSIRTYGVEDGESLQAVIERWKGAGL